LLPFNPEPFVIPSDIKGGLRVFENRMLKRTFVPKRDKMTGAWKNFHNELHNLYSSPSINKMMKPRMIRWAENVARVREKKVAHRILMGTPEGKRPL
jgi:hypothetical protein